jgi:lysozyme family protein
MDFDTAFHKLLGHEGGYVNHPSDPGGETNWGVTVAVARQNGYKGAMQSMPVGVAKDIYKKMYWDAVQADKMPLKLRYALFDAAVNSGVTQAIKWLQRAVNVSGDGVLGPKTLAAVISQDQSKVFDSMVAQRLKFMASLSNWPSFGRGWTRRIAAILEES